ncbi:hypothetical protein PT277_01785 [Acetobacteraceae bacterium ESL0709]|nr:hypothetical protein [Acetobacteraceae bacterium ESL0697]MDF7677433.1 hypothetical protein [Acetobacteraceae bacterium ESL0709]
MEVFSRRSRIAQPSAPGTLQPVALVTPEWLQSFFASRMNELCARFEEWSHPFAVVGQLGVVAPDSWRRYEPLPLIDPATKAEIGLEIPLSLLEETGIKSGDYVQATGFLRARLVKGQIMLRFETLAVRLHDEKAESASQSDASIMALLRDLPSEKHVFPQREGVRLLIINLGVSGRQVEELRVALGALWQERSVRELAFSPADRQKLLQALVTMTEDILVILSDGAGVALLENSYVMKAISAGKAYRILVLDNTASLNHDTGEKQPPLKSVACHLVDHFFPSSVEAGRFIREQSSQAQQIREEERARQEEMNALRDSLARFADLPDVSRNFGLWRGVLIGSLIGVVFVILCLALVHFLHG